MSKQEEEQYMEDRLLKCPKNYLEYSTGFVKINSYPQNIHHQGVYFLQNMWISGMV